ncbi:metal-dependent hydrolase [Longirhabdus pacifica]|uniref:metal-dependent hydrolase n=1 Tax=Longirhabdus pacifica TaxID=2305227 RepID=UPI001008B5C6|nr:metal-dependent hydrolase [Longirhabdus pacifica]
MDSATHFVVGIGLAGLAQIDPVVSGSGTVTTAVMIGTVLGSQAPDTDGLLRLKGNAMYIRNHRGASHSIPALLFWSISITLMLAVFFDPLPLLNVFAWTALAVVIHVFSDLFNTYGTQACRPFTKKWISWDIIHIFDLFIFISHFIAIILWATTSFPPATMFVVLYSLTIVYYIWRTLYRRHLMRYIPTVDKQYQEGDTYLLIPTVRFSQWNVVKTRGKDTYFLGEWKHRHLLWIDMLQCSNHPALEKSKSNNDVASFLYFSPLACGEVTEHDWGIEVKWVDVRYRFRKQYPFVAILYLDHHGNELNSYVGWISNNKAKHKLKMNFLQQDSH